MAGSAEIGIRVFLDDAASSGLYAINGTLGMIGTRAMQAGQAFKGMNNALMMGALLGAGAALLAFGAAIDWSVKQSMAFQDAMASIAINVRGATGPALDELAKNLVRVADASIYNDTEVAQGIARLGVLGVSAQQLNDNSGALIQTMVNLGEAMGTTTVNSAQLLGTTMRMFGLNAKDATRAANDLDFAFKNGNPSVSQLTEAIRQVGPLAHAMGFNLDEVTLALSFFGQAGLQGSVGGTALRMMLNNLSNPTNKASDELLKLGFNTLSTDKAFKTLADQLLATGDSAAKKAVDGFDGTTASIKKMFQEGQRLHLIPFNEDFMKWATDNKVFGNALYDSTGKVRPLKDVMDSLLATLNGLTPQNAAYALEQIFGARANQGAMLLSGHLKDFDKIWAQLQTDMKNTSAQKDAETRTNTLSAAWKEFTTTLSNVGRIVGDTITPTLTKIVQGLNQFMSKLTESAGGLKQAGPLFLGLGAGLSVLAVIAVIVGMAIAGIGTAFLVFAGVAIGVFAGVILLAVGLTALVMWIRQVLSSATPLGELFRQIGGIFHDLFTFLISQGAQAWQGIKQATADLGPSFRQLGAAIQPILPILGLLAAVIGGILIGAIHGIIGALGSFIVGIVHILAGVIQVISGIIMFVTGFVILLSGLFTGNGARIKQGWQSMWNGIVQIAQGIGHIITGLFYATWGTVLAFSDGFVHGIINFFTHLSNILVGHSIIPDMLNAIKMVFMSGLQAVIGFVVGFVTNAISHFLQFGAMVISTTVNAFNMFRAAASAGINAAVSFLVSGVANMISHLLQFGSQVVNTANNAWNNFRNATSNGINAAVNVAHGLPGRVIGAVAGLGNMLFSSGANAMQQFANGLGSTLGAVVDKVKQASQSVADFLSHHSPAKMGPLSDDDQWMPRMMRMMAQGIDEHTPMLASAAQRAAGGIASAPSTARMATPTAGYGTGGMAGGNITVPLVVDGNTIGQVVINRLTGQMQMNGFARAFR